MERKKRRCKWFNKEAPFASGRKKLHTFHLARGRKCISSRGKSEWGSMRGSAGSTLKTCFLFWWGPLGGGAKANHGNGVGPNERWMGFCWNVGQRHCEDCL